MLAIQLPAEIEARLADLAVKWTARSARRVSEELVQKTIGLDELPCKGRMVAELNEDAVHELGLYSYRILYEINPETRPAKPIE
ncbi:type II toxin-antitoxin system RelE/ParE family toxin [Marinobacter sp. SS8-8]|uniref:type II toxin-antitoxin system RelE/ParE family toxin n=1 Tax=Marinobacter sp. SS8-8 TaxID=3050452 RepID=UPI0026E0B0AA|nr:type II toxin-antitoxin system RelE/ParE family toxin [Marinobacter sp. SS8-8]